MPSGDASVDHGREPERNVRPERVLFAGSPQSPTGLIVLALSPQRAATGNGAPKAGLTYDVVNGAGEIAGRLSSQPGAVGVVLYRSPQDEVAICLEAGGDVAAAIASWAEFAVSALACYRAFRPRLTFIEIAPDVNVGEALSNVIGAPAAIPAESIAMPGWLARLAGRSLVESRADLDDLYGEMQACSLYCAADQAAEKVSGVEHAVAEFHSSRESQARLQAEIDDLTRRLAETAAAEASLRQALGAAESTAVESQKQNAVLQTELDLFRTQLGLVQESLDEAPEVMRVPAKPVSRDPKLGTGLTEAVDISAYLIDEGLEGAAGASAHGVHGRELRGDPQ